MLKLAISRFFGLDAGRPELIGKRFGARYAQLLKEADAENKMSLSVPHENAFSKKTG